MLSDFSYVWPDADLAQPGSGFEAADVWFRRDMPETREELRTDSRWPAFFPSPMCLVTTTDGQTVGFEKVVGPSIVNRFPYVAALSFCREDLSDRHHVRLRFSELLETGGSLVIQFLPPGEDLAAALQAIAKVPDERTGERIERSGLAARPGRIVAAPVLDRAYLAYECKLVSPGADFDGNPIFEDPWVDVGSHRIYFLEIAAIQLREDIAQGRAQISWKALPEWSPGSEMPRPSGVTPVPELAMEYQKGYTPNYRFPAANTVAFEADEVHQGMAVKYLDPLPENQVEVDNDRARWPCFFPSSAGMITVNGDDGLVNMMPCGSTTVISRHPLVITPCFSYTSINERYARRASLDLIRRAKSFGCGVAYIDEQMTDAIRYTGTLSIDKDPDKIRHAGLHVSSGPRAPRIDDLPIHFECELVGEIPLGTHIMLLGKVTSIYVRADLAPENPMRWVPWAELIDRPVSD